MEPRSLARRAIARLRPADGGAGRMSVTGALTVIRDAGFSPATVLDVGAAHGGWSVECHSVFPGARYVLFEPLEEYYGGEHSQRDRLPDPVEVHAAAAAAPGKLTINVHHDLVGSSLLHEREGAAVDGTPREVPVVTVDDVVAEHGAPGPYLLKADVQGAELEVLAGAQRVLAETEVVILEVSLFGFFVDGPQFTDVVGHMDSMGFAPYDLYGALYRPLDGALAQVDVVFARRDGVLRSRHEYATAEQRGIRRRAD